MVSDRTNSEKSAEGLQKEDSFAGPLTETVSHVQSTSISGLSAPRAAGVQLKEDGNAVQMESDSWWERVKEDMGEMGMAMGIGGSAAAMAGTTAAGQLGGAVAMGLGLGTMAGEGLWELDKSVLSAGPSSEKVKEPEYAGHNPYAPDWYAPWTW